MSILETFYILFKSDASDVKKGSEEAKKSVDKMNVALTKGEKAADRLGASFLGVAKSLAGIVTAALSTQAIIGGLKDAGDYALNLDQASFALNVNAGELDAWGRAVERFGGNASTFQSSVQSLAQHIGTDTNTAFQLLPQLADAFHQMTRFQALRYGKRIGLDQITILMLQQGRRELGALITKQKELGVVTARDIEIVEKYNTAFTNASDALRGAFLRVDETVLPIMTKLYNGLTKIGLYFQKHPKLIVGALIGIAGAAALIATPFIAANAAVIALTAAVTGLIATFAVLFEDIDRYLSGEGGSLLGKLIKEKGVNYSLGTKLFGPKDGSSIFDWLHKGKEQINTASMTPLNSTTSNSLFNSRFSSRNQNYKIGDVTINTAAQDGGGIASAFMTNLQSQFYHANGYFDDGTLY